MFPQSPYISYYTSYASYILFLSFSSKYINCYQHINRVGCKKLILLPLLHITVMWI